MCLGALIHAGVPLEYLTKELGKLGISDEYSLRVEKVHRNGQLATKLHVDIKGSTQPPHQHISPHNHGNHEHNHEHGHEHPHDSAHDNSAKHRHLPEIEEMIAGAGLPERVSQWSLAVFRRLAEAEGAVHGIAPEQVHFHEVGATDAIVDIVGTCLGLDWLGIETLYCSALPTGGGTVWADHGRLPVPVPAVLQLWQMRRCPVYSNGIDKELVTPTGAAIAVALVLEFGPPPPMHIEAIGLGAGSQQLPIANILRLWIGWRGNALAADQSYEAINSPQNLETVAVLETQIDDTSPQAIAYTSEILLRSGALDVFSQAITMKKSRLGVLLSVVCPVEQAAECEAIIFRETTTLGIRRTYQGRSVLHRQIQTVQTEHGTVRVKVAWQEEGQILNIQPEYEDCAALAAATNRPWQAVHAAALQAWHQQLGSVAE